MFYSVKDPIQNLHNVSKSLKRTIKYFTRAAGAHVIKHQTFSDALTMMLYCYSASTDGDFEKIHLRLVDYKPYIEVDKQGLKSDHYGIVDRWNDLVETLETAPNRLEELRPQLNDIIERIPNFPEEAKSGMESLGPMDKLRATKCIAVNCNRLSGVKKVLEETKEVIENLNTAIKGLSERFATDEMAKTHVVGKAAFAANIFEPIKICAKFWPDKKKVDLKLDKKKKKSKH
mmetsp:Transcript_7380/g.7239  ORF Transcript_7380/g.7239 Transcript_7380/m.7239 type:complete len:231 (+) Transcript_7380:76-768(+)